MNRQNQIQITSGEYRGRKLVTPGGQTHPMGARERLALFNILGERIREAVVVDAYAGAGTLGIEALSRGAAKAVFVENAASAMCIIRENCDLLRILSDRVEFHRASVRDFCAKIAEQCADIVLADPPYDAFDETEVECLEAVLKSGGIMVLSHPGPAPRMAGSELLRTRRYARAHLSLYRKY